MPKWLAFLSYLVAVALLIVSNLSMWITLAFPVWVLVVSVLFLARAGVIEIQRDAHSSPISAPGS